MEFEKDYRVGKCENCGELCAVLVPPNDRGYRTVRMMCPHCDCPTLIKNFEKRGRESPSEGVSNATLGNLSNLLVGLNYQEWELLKEAIDGEFLIIKETTPFANPERLTKTLTHPSFLGGQKKD